MSLFWIYFLLRSLPFSLFTDSLFLPSLSLTSCKDLAPKALAVWSYLWCFWTKHFFKLTLMVLLVIHGRSNVYYKLLHYSRRGNLLTFIFLLLPLNWNKFVFKIFQRYIDLQFVFITMASNFVSWWWFSNILVKILSY